MKALNVFGIILAWILSIAMVVMLLAAPLVLSALSVLDPEELVQTVSGVLVENIKPSAAKPQETIVLQNLSAETEVSAENNVSEEMKNQLLSPEGNALDGFRGLLGDNIKGETLNKLLTSNAATELLDAYTKDFANALIGKEAEKEFTSELLVEVIANNIDEIVQIAEEANGTTLSDELKEELKSQIISEVQKNAEQIVAEMPAPEEVKESLVDGNKELELALNILAKKNEIKGAIVGAIVLISLLIFGLRYPGLRGMRWLSTNLFTAGGFNVLICIVLGLSTSAVKGVTAGINALDGAEVEGVIATLLGQLTKGMIIRTVIIFVAAIALLVGYILLKPFVGKKKVKAALPADEEVIPEAVPVFVPDAVAVEQEVVAEEPAQESAPVEEI